jgi:hypothetical protein
MSLTGDDYKDLLYRLLPRGPIWPSASEDVDHPVFDSLLDAISNEPARVDLDVTEHLAALFPDSTDDRYLPSWIRLLGLPGDATQADVLALLAAPEGFRLADLQAAADLIATGIVVRDQLHSPMVVGGLVGTALESEQTVVTFEYMASLTADPDPDVAVGTPTLSVGSSNVPNTVSRFGISSTRLSLLAAGTATYSVPTTGPSKASLWVRSPVAGTAWKWTVQGVDQQTFTQGSAWAKLEAWADVGAGPLTLRITNTSGSTQTLDVSWLTAGSRDTAEEVLLARPLAAHTLPEWAVVGEYGP